MGLDILVVLLMAGTRTRSVSIWSDVHQATWLSKCPCSNVLLFLMCRCEGCWSCCYPGLPAPMRRRILTRVPGYWSDRERWAVRFWPEHWGTGATEKGGQWDFDPITGVQEWQRKVGSEILTRVPGYWSDRERWAVRFWPDYWGSGVTEKGGQQILEFVFFVN